MNLNESMDAASGAEHGPAACRGLHLFIGLLLVIGTSAVTRAQTTPGPAQTDQSQTASEDQPRALFGEPAAMSRFIEKAGRKLDGGGEPKNGFYLETEHLITGSGWIPLGPGYRHRFRDGHVYTETSAAVSWRAYTVVQGRAELPKLAGGRVILGTQALWRDAKQVNYFGTGPDSLEANRSEYRIRSTNVVGYGAFKLTDRLAIAGRVGWLSRPDIGVPAGTFDRGFPPIGIIFPDEPALQLALQPSYLHSDVGVAWESRNNVSYPTRGGVYGARWTNFSDRDTGRFSFQQYELEGMHVVPVVRDRLTFAAHAFAVLTDVPAGNGIPFYMLPSLGGHNSLRGAFNYRYHDRNLLLLSGESRVGLTPHIDVALFTDVGSVAANASDLNLDKVTYGAGLRVHTQSSTLARLDVARGEGAWYVMFRLNDPFRLSRLKIRTVLVPFTQ